MTTQERVRSAVAEVLHVPVEQVNPRLPLHEVAKLDSMHLAEIASALDEEFGIRVRYEALDATLSIEDLTRIVEATASDP